MDIPVTRTKIIVPRRRPDLLSRSRLTDLLVDLLDNKLIILAAPAGYGKTSLLVDVTHQTNLPFCWYSLDPLDRDLIRFVSYLIASINHRFPEFGLLSSQVLQSINPANPDLNQLVTTIVNEAFDTIHEHFVIVLDDYHLVDDRADINQFIGLLAQAIDENCHIAIASRTLLSLPDLPLMVARSQVGGLGFEELAFQAEEVRSLLQQNYQQSISEAAANQIVQQTEGWITGLLLSTQAEWHGLPDRSRLARVSSVGLYDYLAQQVLDQQPAPIRDFLLRTSLFEEFDADICEAVLGPPAEGESWSASIDAILRNNLFVLPIGEKGLWIRYHHLFRDFLQNRMKQENPVETRQIQTRMAEVYANRGEWERAHEIYQRVGSTEGLLSLVEKAGTSLMKAGRLTILSAWVDDLPPDQVADHPILLSLRGGVAVMLGQVERGLALLNHSETALRSSGNLAELVKTLDRRSHAYRFLGYRDAALRDAEEALSLTEGRNELRSLRATALRTKGIILYRFGNALEAIDCLKSAEALYDVLGMEDYVAIVRIDLGSIYRSHGEFNNSRFAYENALHYFKKTGDLARQATVLNNLGVLHHHVGDYDIAARYFEQAVSCSSQSGYTRIEALALASIGDLYCDLDAPDAALTAYQRASDIAERLHDRFLTFYLTLAHGITARKMGNMEKASEWLQKAIQAAQAGGSTYEQGLCHLEAGRQYLLSSKPNEAIVHLTKAQDLFSSSQQRLETVQTKLYLSSAWHSVKEPRKAIALLQEAFDLNGDVDNNQSIVSCARDIKDVIILARGEKYLAQQSTKLLDKLDTLEATLPSYRRHLRRFASTVPFAEAKLTVRALGKIIVQVDSTLVPGPKWQAQVARDMLLLLLAHPEGMTKEDIAGIFWTNASQNQVKLQFKNTVYRVRHALGLDAVILEDDHYIFNRGLDYEYDVETFQNQIDRAQKQDSIDEQIVGYKTAIHLYKGPYLPDIEGTWVWNERQRLYHIYVNALLRLADLYIQAGEYNKCLDICQTAFQRDPCLEEAHRLAMRAHAGLGNKADVVRQFERCEQTLLREVNLPPSPQTRQLFETLIR